VSSRHTRSFFGVMLAVVFALSAVVVAPASAKLSKHQKAHIRKQLKRAIKKNPKLIRSKHFIKKASLVDFTLPVTIKLRQSDLAHGDFTGANNPNHATIDLGPSLGQRDIYLGGSLPAEIQFHDSFDGGALGNVDLKLTTGGNLTTTSIPLLWNNQVSAGSTSWSQHGTAAGCGDFVKSATTSLPNLFAGTPFSPPAFGGTNAPPAAITTGAPVFDPGAPLPSPAFALNALTFATQLQNFADSPSLTTQNAIDWTKVTGTAEEIPGVDAVDNLNLSDVPGNSNNVGTNPNPFPTAGSYAPQQDADPGYPNNAPTWKDAVLRTNALSLSVMAPGTFDQSAANPQGSGPGGSDKITVGPSGGQANLFGDIPGKSYGIDVTVSLQTAISSLIRQIDADNAPIIHTAPAWPSAAFQCRQAWTGAVQNVLAGIHLTGKLHISPAITSDGSLRIAKASLKQQSIGTTTQKTRIALAACLVPYSAYAHETNNNSVPAAGNIASAQEPIDATVPGNINAPGVPCNSTPDATVASVGAHRLPDASTISTTADGSQVSVAGDLDVKDIEADVLIGKNQP
jgi:hypothetical protein